MPVHNSDIAGVFNKVADLLDIRGANRFRVRAYRNAAQTVAGLSRNVADLIAKGEDLSGFSGIGEDLAGKIEEVVETGTLKLLRELEAETPEELTELMKMETLGPKRVKAIYDQLEIKDLGQLKEAAEKNQIQKLQGFGQKTEEKILEEIERFQKEGERGRYKLAIADEFVQSVKKYLADIKSVKRVEVAGSYRRRKETVGDIDILVSCKRGSDVMDKFVNYEDVDRVIAKGKTKSSVILRNGLQVDLRVVPAVGYGAALYYFTGSKAHNIAVRKIAVNKGLKINEYGVYRADKRIAGKTEKAVLQKVGLRYIPPELRENTGEIAAAQKGKLPKLVELKDIRGDLQSHTTATDGKYSLREMAEAARKKGYEYLAVTDHSKRVSMAGGLDEKALGRHIAEMEKLNETMDDFRILKSVEVDILEDGTLDLSDEILRELDIVICSIHYNTKLSRKRQTRRVLKAMENPNFNIFAHPTGRLLGEREGYEIDLEAVMKAARENGCFLELNAQPDRLDLSDTYCKMAKEMGVKIAISTDAHTVSDLDNMEYGIGQARRGWLEAADVLNTRRWKNLQKLIRR